MKTFFAMLATTFLVTGSAASAVTVEAGKTYLGSFIVDEADIQGNACCTYSNFAGGELIGSLWMFDVGDPLNLGETLSYRILDSGMNEVLLNTGYESLSPTSTGLGFTDGGYSASFGFEGFFEFTVGTTTTFELTELFVIGKTDADFLNSTTGATGVTSLQTRSPVLGISALMDDDYDTPAVPLPASLLLLIGGLAGLGAFRGCRVPQVH